MARSSTTKAQHWWTASEEDAHAYAFDVARQIARQLQGRRTDDALYMTMYGAGDVAGGGSSQPPNNAALGSSALSGSNGLDRLKFNLVRSVVNTAASHIASKRPKPKFQTNDAEWGLTRKARVCELAVKGIFESNKYYDLALQAFLDGAISSLGSLHVFSEGSRVKIERAFPGEILVDAREGYYGAPLTMYRVRLVDRQVLESRFGVEAKSASSAREDDVLVRQFAWMSTDIADPIEQCVFLEAWRLGPVGKDGKRKGGKYIACVSNETVELRDWDRERFPFAFIRWERRQFGFFGCGIVEELRGHQRALNYLHAKIGDTIHKNSRSNLVVFDGSGGKPSVSVNHVDNDPATIIRVRNAGQAPIQLTANAVPSELFAYRREIIQDGYSQIGLSELRATGQVPRGVKSGAAMRELNDTSSQRWATKAQDQEQLAVDVARLIVDELADLDEPAKVRTTFKRGRMTQLQEIDWSENALEDHEYELSVTPASSLPDSTAGRTDTVQDWMASGLVTPEEAKSLLDFPDIDRFQSMDLAAHEVCLDTIEQIIEDGEYHPPEPTDDLVLCVKLATQSYNRFRLRRAPEDRLALLLQYLDDLKAMLEAAQGAAQQQQPAAPGQVPAQPGSIGTPAGVAA